MTVVPATIISIIGLCKYYVSVCLWIVARKSSELWTNKTGLDTTGQQTTKIGVSDPR